MKAKIHPQYHRLVVHKDGRVFSLHKGDWIKPHYQRGYPCVTYSAGKRGDKRRNAVLYFHLLVLETFVGPRPDGYQGAHLDGNPKNCDLSNLAWVTKKENNNHRKLHGTLPMGEIHALSKLTDEQVRYIRANFKHEKSMGKVIGEYAKSVGVHKNTVVSALDGKTWKHIVDKSIEQFIKEIKGDG